MTHKVLGREATKRILDHMLKGRPLPQKIVEHKERMEAAMVAADRRHRFEDSALGSDQDEMKCLLNMRHGLDALYTSWAEGIERIRWVDLPKRDDITPEIVVRECVMSTESCFGSTGVEVLAVYLDACGYDRLLFRLGEACTLHVREYLESAVPALTYDFFILDKPAEYFGTTDQDVLQNNLVDHFSLYVNKTSPRHVIRAMIANIEWGIGNAVQAINDAGFAYCEATVEQFGLKLHMDHPDVDKAFEEWELWKAERLLGFLK